MKNKIVSFFLICFIILFVPVPASAQDGMPSGLPAFTPYDGYPYYIVYLDSGNNYTVANFTQDAFTHSEDSGYILNKTGDDVSTRFYYLSADGSSWLYNSKSFLVKIGYSSELLYANYTIYNADGSQYYPFSVSDDTTGGDGSAYPLEVPAPSPVEASQVVDGLLTSSVSFYDSVACLVFDFGPDWQNVFEQSGSNLTITGRYNYLFVGSYNSDDDIIEDSAGNTGSGLFTYYPAMDGLEVNTPYAWVSYNADTDSLDVISNSYNDSIDSTLTLSDCYLWGDPVGTYPYCFAFYHPDSAVALQWNGVSLLQNTNSISNFMWDYYDAVPPSDDSDDGQGDTNIYVDFTETNSLLRSIKEIVHGISNSIVTLPEKIFDSFSEMLNIINDSVSNGFADIKTSIANEFANLKVAIENGFDSVIEAIQNQEIKVEVDDDGKSVFDYILDALNPVASFFGALAGSAIDGVIEAAEFASNIGSDVFDFLKNALLQILPIIALIASLGGWLVSLYGFLPPEFASFISVMVSILIVGILVKIALNVK